VFTEPDYLAMKRELDALRRAAAVRTETQARASRKVVLFAVLAVGASVVLAAVVLAYFVLRWRL
jgi:hypothetical protein